MKNILGRTRQGKIVYKIIRCAHLKGRKPPDNAKLIVTIVLPATNAKSWEGRAIEHRNTSVDPFAKWKCCVRRRVKVK